MTDDQTAADTADDLYGVLRRAGARRKRALKKADGELSVIVAQVALVLTTGVTINMERAAREAAISKKTLYDRLRAAGTPVPDADDA